MNNLILEGGNHDLPRSKDPFKITINRDTTLNAINVGLNLNLDIKIQENATLILNLFDYEKNRINNIRCENYDNSKFILNAGFISENLYELNVDTNLYGDNIETSVNIRGINEEDSKVNITMNGTVAGLTHNNVLNEYAKIINKSTDTNVLIPNLLVNTNDVVANHGVSIGTFRNSELFYLNSKGIQDEDAKKMIEEGFILSIMDDKVKERIKNILIGR